MKQIIADVPTTRRKRLHYVINEHDEVIFTSASMVECIAYLTDQGVTRITLQDEEGNRFLLNWEQIP